MTILLEPRPADTHATTLRALAAAALAKGPALDLISLVLDAHAPVSDEEASWCEECFDDEAPYESWTWPCRFYTAAAAAVGAQA